MNKYQKLNLQDGDILNEDIFTHIDNSFIELYDIVTELNGSEGMNYSDLSVFEKHNGYISSTGVWGNFNEKYQYIVIPITGGNPVLKMTGNGSQAMYYAGLKSFKTPVNGEAVDFATSEGWSSRKSLSKTGSVDTVLPSDVKFLVLMLTNNRNDTTPSVFSLTSDFGGGPINDLLDRVEKLEVSDINWIALGDSITEGFYSIYNEGTEDYESHRAMDKSWVSVVAKQKGFNLTNKGVGGSGWLKRGTTQAPKLNAREQIDAVNEDGTFVLDFTKYDLCTIAWGVNDWKGKMNLGTFEDGINPEVESVYANIRYCLETIQRRNPNMKIIVISPIQCAIGSSSYEGNYAIGTLFEGLTIVPFYEAIKECCEYYGIEFVDMLYTGVVNRLNITTLLPDKVHPSLEAHVLMGKELAGKISYGK